MDIWQGSTGVLEDTLFSPADPYLLGLIIVGWTSMFALIWWVLHDHRGMKMGRDTVKISDIITDALDEAVAAGKISQKYARYWTLRIAQRADIPDMRRITRLGKKLHPRRINQLKEQIKWRLYAWRYQSPGKFRLEGDGPTEPMYIIGGGRSAPLPADPPSQQKESSVKREKFKSFANKSAA